MPSDPITAYEFLFARRLRHILSICDLSGKQLANEYYAQFHSDLSLSLISRWLSAERRVMPTYYQGLKTLLSSHLKMAATTPEYGLEQEFWDWDGLVYNDEQLKREKHRPKPVILGGLPRSRPGAGHFYRKSIRDEIMVKLLNPDPETGLFQPGRVILTGLPGSGRTEMVAEIL